MPHTKVSEPTAGDIPLGPPKLRNRLGARLDEIKVSIFLTDARLPCSEFAPSPWPSKHRINSMCISRMQRFRRARAISPHRCAAPLPYAPCAHFRYGESSYITHASIRRGRSGGNISILNTLRNVDILAARRER